MMAGNNSEVTMSRHEIFYMIYHIEISKTSVWNKSMRTHANLNRQTKYERINLNAKHLWRGS